MLIVASVFFYFLIFAQFGFLHRIAETHPPAYLNEIALFSMGFGGILGCIIAARCFSLKHAKSWLMAGFIACGLSATTVAAIPNIWIYIVIAFGVGLFLGILTVVVVPILSNSFPGKSLGTWTALGVGTAYACSNIPIIFNSSPQNHCIIGGMVCALGVVLSNYLPSFGTSNNQETNQQYPTPIALYLKGGVIAVVAMFLALIWLDSAVFYIIQETESLKSSTWSTDGQLWTIAIIHFIAAIVAGKCLDKGWIFQLLIFALLLLSLGAWKIIHPSAAGSSLPIYIHAYVVAVSLYSTSLVAYAALRPETKNTPAIPTRAAWVFAVSGWVGSGMGIGMAKDLNTIPNCFFLIAFCISIAGVMFLKFSYPKKSTELHPALAK